MGIVGGYSRLRRESERRHASVTQSFLYLPEMPTLAGESSAEGPRARNFLGIRRLVLGQRSLTVNGSIRRSPTTPGPTTRPVCPTTRHCRSRHTRAGSDACEGGVSLGPGSLWPARRSNRRRRAAQVPPCRHVQPSEPEVE